MDNERVKLDLKDKRLLYEIDMDARMTYTQLGKKIGLSKQGAENKLKNLIKKGVIKGFYPVINVPKLGYLYCRIAFAFHNITKEKEKEIINFQKKNNKFFWIFTVQGEFDIFSGMWVKSITEFKEEVTKFMTKYGKYIKSKDESITTDVIHYQHRYLLGKKETKEIHVKESDEAIKLTNNEKKLLMVLTEDARMPIVKIAEKIGVSPKVAAYTLKKLERNGIVEGYRPILDNHKLGFSYYKIWINLSYDNKEDIERLYRKIRDNPIVVYRVVGFGFPEDLDIEIMVKDNIELFNFIKELKNEFPKLIGNYKTIMFANTEKVRYLPF